MGLLGGEVGLEKQTKPPKKEKKLQHIFCLFFADTLIQFSMFEIYPASNSFAFETLGVISHGGEVGQITQTFGRRN